MNVFILYTWRLYSNGTKQMKLVPRHKLRVWNIFTDPSLEIKGTLMHSIKLHTLIIRVLVLKTTIMI